MQIAPGEPVPPGFENEVKPVAEIQTKIDNNKSAPFIGLEYLLELNMHDNKEPSYLCVLCEKHGDPRTIMDHLTSYKHRLKYLVNFSSMFRIYINQAIYFGCLLRLCILFIWCCLWRCCYFHGIERTKSKIPFITPPTFSQPINHIIFQQQQ